MAMYVLDIPSLGQEALGELFCTAAPTSNGPSRECIDGHVFLHIHSLG
jgi:hypothetical protein